MRLLFPIVFLLTSVFSLNTFGQQSPKDSVQVKEDTIVFLLPFNSQKIFIKDLSQSDYFFPNETQLAVEYYQGALLAFDSLKKIGLKARVIPVDIGSDSASIKAALENPELKKADLIYGPFGGYALKAAAGYARENQIPFVSPMSAAVYSLQPNPFLVLPNATLRTHCETMYNYLLQHDSAQHIILLYRSKNQELELVKYMKQYCDTLSSNGAIRLHLTEVVDSVSPLARLDDSLFITQKNVVIIFSNDESFVRNALNHISKLSADYRVDVMGMPSWSSFTSIPAALFDSMHAVISTSFFVSKNATVTDKFKDAYHEMFKVNPSAMSARGYDQAFYFASHFLNGSTNYFERFPAATLLASQMNIVPVMKGTAVSYYENKSTFILQYRNGEWVKY